MASGGASSSPGASQPRTTSGAAPAVLNMILPRDAFLVFVSNIEDLLRPCHLRSVMTCSRATSWPMMQRYITNVVKTIMEKHHVQYVAAQESKSPRSSMSPRATWTEKDPICSSPLCNNRTGLWLPSREEITTLTDRPQDHPFDYMCANHEWGSLSLRCVIADVKAGLTAAWDNHGRVRAGGRALVVCSVECGKDVREIARIQRKHDYVLLASRDRVLPDADRAMDVNRGFVDERYLLESEIAGRETRGLRALRAELAGMPPFELRII